MTHRIEITRSEAKARGLTHFFTGAPCENGHVAERYVSNLQCVECNRAPLQALAPLLNKITFKL